MTMFLHDLWPRLRKFAERPWYLPAISALAAADLFILVVPSDALLISAVLLAPRRWIRAFLWVSTGSALGAFLLAALLHWDAPMLMDGWLRGAFQSETWQSTSDFISSHGFWALAALALSPFPQQPAVAVSALGGMSSLSIFVSVWVGRAIKYSLFAWMASHAPRLLGKFSVGREAFEITRKENEPKS